MLGLVLDEGGGVVPGARVWFERLADLAPVHTDAQGTFTFEGVPPGQHVLAASHEGRQVRQRVLVRRAEAQESVELVLAPGVRLSGLVTDGAERPLVDVKVSVSGGPFLPTQETKTDARGRFSHEPMAPGRYELTLQAVGYVPVTMPARWIETSEELVFVLRDAEQLEGQALDERGSPVEGVRLWLETERGRMAGTASLSRAQGAFSLGVPSAGTWVLRAEHPGFLPEKRTLTAPSEQVRLVMGEGGALEVEVRDAEGQPLAEARVDVQSPPPPPEAGAEAGAGAGGWKTATTGADGRALLQGLASGRHRVGVRDRERGGFARSEVEVVERGTARLRLQLEPSWTLSGEVVDERGEPLEGVRLLVRGIGPDVVRISHPLVSDAEGRFTLAHLGGASWRLCAEEYRRVTDPASRGPHERLCLDDVGPDEPHVRLVLKPRRRVHGRALHENGEPVTSFWVNDTRVEDPEGRFSVRVSQEDSERRSAVRLRETRLILTAPGLFADGLLVPAREEDVEVGDVVLRENWMMRGQVTDARTSAPVAGALVVLGTGQEVAGAAVAYTRPDGHFELEAAMSSDQGWLRVSHPDHPSPVNSRISRGQQDVRIRLEPGASVEGRVELEGTPVERGTVRLFSEREHLLGEAPIWRGRYLLRVLPAGRHRVEVKGPRDDGPAVLFPPRQVELVAGERVTLDFTGQRTGASVEVLVQEPDIEIHLLPGELTVTGREGLYSKLSRGLMGKAVREGVRRFSHVLPGHYTLVAVHRDEWGTGLHLEPLEVPSEGALSFALLPLWTRYDD